MSRLELAIVIHNHQPVGNFDSIDEDAYARAYLPFLEFLERRPDVRIGLHNSGCLWEWLDARHPEYGEKLAALVRRKQVELLGGGYFEPILPLWPQRDRRGQIRKMQDDLEERFGVRPRGIWLAERVWEPQLASDLAAEGIEYLCLDDTQFLQVGLKDEELTGHFRTEDGGASVSLFPIQMQLRYEIPFAPPETVIETLRRSASDAGGALRLFGDDGEKFGTWPGTHRLCYEEQWLDRFFDAVARQTDWLSIVLPSEHLDGHPPIGRIYLPAGSYREMTEWALPPQARALYESTHRFLIDRGQAEAERILLKGGFFRNFLARYEESNRMHKRVLYALDRLDDSGLEGARADAIRVRLWRAQCNCAYWHGVFGGLYLPHLREGIYREILEAERDMDEALHDGDRWSRTDRLDFDGDGHEEIVLATPEIQLILSPRRGGGLIALDDRSCARNLANTLTRRPEAYHSRLDEEAAGDDARVRTIHDSITAKEEGLERLLVYDAWERLSLTDRIFLDPAGPEDLLDDGRSEAGGFAGRPYAPGKVRRRRGIEIELSREGAIGGEEARCLRIEKSIRIPEGQAAVEVGVRFRSRSAATLEFEYGMEWLLNMLAGRAHDRFVRVDGKIPEDPALAGAARHEGSTRIALVDEWLRERVDLHAKDARAIVRAPLETVSLSESGAERVFQGTILMPVWLIRLSAGEEMEIRMRLELRHGPSIGDWTAP